MRPYALVVGIAQYDDSLLRLTKPTNDAEAVARVLEEYGDFKVTRLPEGWNSERNAYEVAAQRLNGENLGQGLEDFLKQAKMKEALIYFSGHGFTVSDNLRKKKGYLGTSDCTSSTIATRGISLDSLNQLILESNLSSLVVLLDCCHAGSILENNLMRHSMTTFNSSQKDYYLIAACRDFESSWEGKQYSVFTEALLKGLQVDNAGSDGKVSCDRLFDTINTELKRSGQEPIRMGWGSSITLVTYKHQRQAQTFEVKNECPYQGLKAFEAEQKEFFFGRKQVVREILAKLNKKPFVPIIGASGSGKSSVVRAGLIPQLDDNEWQVLKPIMPGFKPLRKLSAAFEQFFEGPEKEEELENLIYTEPNSLPAILKNLPGSAKFLLVVDQFEEVFTGGANQQEKQRFIDLLTQVVEITDSRLAVVITMRADFLEPCLDYPCLTHLIQTQAVFMPPLTGVDLKDTIAEPAKFQGHSVEEGLVLKILEDVKQEPGFLPLLEFALTKLWDERDQEKHQLTLEEYEKLGGLTGALNLHAEKVYHCQNYQKESPTPERSQQEKEWIQRIFLRLVRTGEGEKDTRQRQPKATLLNIAGDDPKQRQQLSKLLDGEAGLVKGRLLVTGNDEQGEAWIDLAHEALIEGWQQFAQWRQKDRNLRRLSDRLEDTRQEWLKKRKDEKYLMQGGLLAEVRDSWQQLRPHLELPEVESFYLDSNKYEKDRIAELESALAESRLREKAARVQNLIPTQPLDALLLAVEAVKENLNWISKKDQKEPIPIEILAEKPGSILGVVQAALNEAVARAIIPNVCEEHQEAVNSVAFSSDGEMIVSGGHNTAYFWDSSGKIMSEPKQLSLCGDKNYFVNSIAFSSESKKIVGGSSDGIVRVWSFDGKLLCTLQGHEAQVNSVALSPNGTTIVSGSEDKTIRLWNINGKSIGKPLRGHEGSVYSVAFSPNGTTIVSGSEDKTIRLWNINGKSIGEALRGHEGSVYSVAFSSNETTIVSGSEDTTVRLWSIEGKPIGHPMRGHDLSIRCVAFSRDGQKIVSGSEDTTVRLWSIEGKPIGHPLRGHEDSVYSVAFSPDGEMIVSGSSDTKIILWAITNHNPILELLNKHEDSVNSVAFSPDGKMIVSGSSDETLRLWNSTGEFIKKLDGHEGSVNSVAFSPDGKMIVSGSSDETLRLWNSTGEFIKKLDGHEDSVNSVAFSPEKEMIVSGSSDSTIRLWDIQGNCISKANHTSGYRIFSVAFSPNGQMIASGASDGQLCLWQINNNGIMSVPLWTEQRRNVGKKCANDDVNCVAFSPNGQMIVSGTSDGQLRLWNLEGKNSNSWLAHANDEIGVKCVGFSRDGQMIISGGSDKVIRLWDIKGNPIGQAWSQHEDIVTSVAFSPDGKMIATCSPNNKIYLWRGGWQEWLEICCKRLASIILKYPHKDMNEFCEICVSYKFWRSADFAAILKAQGISWANSLDEDKAAKKFIKAKEYASDLEFEPKAEATQLAALSRMEQLSILVEKGRIKEVIQAYSVINKTLGTSAIPADQCNDLCWFSSLYGYSDDPIVIDACEKAVELEPNNGNYRETRGVSKVLRTPKTLEERNRNIEEAIEDFQAYIADETIHDEDEKRKYQQLINALQVEENDFSKEEIKKLLELE